ncbi:MAG: hypothetical protein KGO82_06995 [Bacteroidota bacterium]|nr:hypothetical protein [Bacteroidota bacterium]
MKKIFKRFRQIKAIQVVAFILLLGAACLSCNFIVPRRNKLYSIGLAIDMPTNTEIVDGVLKSVQSKDTIQISFIEDIRIYRFAPTHIWKTESDGTMTETGAVVPDSHPYFCFRAGDEKGLYFPRPKDGGTPLILPVDSILIASGFKGMMISIPNDKLPKLNGPRIEMPFGFEQRIANSFKKNETDFDSLYLTFSKNMDTRGLTLSKQLDSAYGTRLIKWSMLFNEYFSSLQNQPVPKRHFSLEFIADPPINEQRVDSVLAVYRAMKQ